MKEANQIKEPLKLEIESVFKNNGDIPDKFTCKGVNTNPPLTIKNIPKEAESLLLIIEDPDAPGGTFTHWVVWNIGTEGKIGENTVPGTQGANDFGKNTYSGPCPPAGTTHRYVFRVYALNTKLASPEGTSRAEIEKQMADHITGQGELTGKYGRQQAAV